MKAWSQNAQNQVKVQPQQSDLQPESLPEGAKPGIAIGEIDAKSVIPDDTTLFLTNLYKQAIAKQNENSKNETESSGTEEEKVTEKISDA